MTYEARWNKVLVATSALTTLILLAIAAAVFYAARREPSVLAIAGLPLLILLLAILFAVRGYRIDGATLFVQRTLWETEVDLRGLESAAVEADAIKGSFRLLGNGGLYSLSGLFRNKRLGTYRAWITNWDDLVVLRFRDRRPVVVSPSKSDEFVERLRARLPNAGRVAE